MNQEVIDVCSVDWGLTSLHSKLLEILDYFDAFCNEHSLQYSLAYGTALGAIRHKGFIPWDDDVDVYLMADDYKKFRSAFLESGDKERFYLQELGGVNGMVTMAKLRMNGTTCIEPLYKNYDMHQGIYIDIFILFPAPQKVLNRKMMNLSNQYLILKGLSNRHYLRRKAWVPILVIMRAFPHNFGRKSAYKKLFKHYKNLSADVFDPGVFTYKQSFYPYSFVFPSKCVEFGGHSLCVPREADSYLKVIYGDYMKVPSYESILRSQHATIWNVSEDFRKYAPNIDTLQDERKTL